MNLGPVEIGLIVLAVMLLFGYKKLPDASRSLGRSLRSVTAEVTYGDAGPRTAPG
jgi:sec-independent protein translocase protein TatA